MLVAAVAVLLLVCVGLSGCQQATDATYSTSGLTTQAVEERPSASTPRSTAGMPCLLDLGAGKCVPCKMMAPILKELREEYAGSLGVVFIDVWQDPSAAEKFGVQTIPTQIFLDSSGKELFRHVGFFSKEEILAKWEELGVEVRKKAQGEDA